MTVNAIHAAPPESRVMPDNTIAAALRQEREEIARLLRAEAALELRDANELEAAYDHREVAEEVWAHRSEARLLDRWADLILARTPVVAEPEAPEIAF